jgi:phosphatidylserine/phosphatidylglycerophosphate/cardiolipin synthase-like enzyme
VVKKAIEANKLLLTIALCIFTFGIFSCNGVGGDDVACANDTVYIRDTIYIGDMPKDNIQAYFSRVDPCDEIIIGLLDSAKHEVNIAVYSITRTIIANAIIRTHKRGVSVKMITDAEQANFAGSQVQNIEQGGVPMKKVDHPGTGAMHHKFAVVDKRITVTGSFNWTTNATNNNDENLLVIESAEIALKHHKEFERILAY